MRKSSRRWSKGEDKGGGKSRGGEDELNQTNLIKRNRTMNSTVVPL